LSKVIIVCEGWNDRIFLQETITYKLSVSHKDIKAYSNKAALDMDIRRNNQAYISILEGNGFPNCVKIAVHSSRELWYLNIPQSIGIIADSNHHPVYNKMIDYLTSYLNTPCKTHNIKPQITRFDQQHTIVVDYGYLSKITMWTLEVPDNLEKQIANSLKRKYPNTLNKYRKDDDIIMAASRILKISKNDIIKKSVKLLENKKWFETFCLCLKKKITSNC
jgi:hypothetical protein